MLYKYMRIWFEYFHDSNTKLQREFNIYRSIKKCILISIIENGVCTNYCSYFKYGSFIW